MTRTLGTLVVVALLAAGTAYAQEAGAGGGRFEIGAFPAGGFAFVESENGAEPDFTNFAVGGSLTANLNHWLGVESEIGWAPGMHQRVSFNAQTFDDQHTPCMFGYNGSVVVSPFGNNRRLVPYASGGLGGLTLLDIAAWEGGVFGFGVGFGLFRRPSHANLTDTSPAAQDLPRA